MGKFGVSAGSVAIEPSGEAVRVNGLMESVVEIERVLSEMVQLEMLDRRGELGLFGSG
jgi:hypothetical protein